jgi:hypothetical protein
VTRFNIFENIDFARTDAQTTNDETSNALWLMMDLREIDDKNIFRKRNHHNLWSQIKLEWQRCNVNFPKKKLSPWWVEYVFFLIW